MKRGGHGAVALRYALFQVPGILAAGCVLVLLVRAELLAERGAWLLFALWLAKEVVLFPLTRIAYARGGEDAHAERALRGAGAVLNAPLAPGEIGWVRIGAELWRAELAPEVDGALAAGARVRIREVRGLVLRVEPLP